MPQALLAVYSAKPPITSSRLARIAASDGWAVRFIKFGIYADPARFRGHSGSLAGASETYLLCGWREPGTDAARAFDAACESGNREALGKLMKGGDIAWVELYTDKFSYEATVRRKPRDQAGIDGSVPEERLPLVRSAKARYIFHNKSRRSTSAEFMSELATLLANAADGVLANNVRPTR